jgi:hypothetical protein
MTAASAAERDPVPVPGGCRWPLWLVMGCARPSLTGCRCVCRQLAKKAAKDEAKAKKELKKADKASTRAAWPRHPNSSRLFPFVCALCAGAG